MIIKNVKEIIKQTGAILDYPEEVIQDVIFAQFKDLKNFLNSPDIAKYRLIYLGSFRGKPKAIDEYLRKLIRRLREEPTEELKEEFRTFWKYRKMLQEDKELSSYKKRFGTWHWKSKDIDKTL